MKPKNYIYTNLIILKLVYICSKPNQILKTYFLKFMNSSTNLITIWYKYLMHKITFLLYLHIIKLTYTYYKFTKYLTFSLYIYKYNVQPLETQNEFLLFIPYVDLNINM